MKEDLLAVICQAPNANKMLLAVISTDLCPSLSLGLLIRFYLFVSACHEQCLTLFHFTPWNASFCLQKKQSQTCRLKIFSNRLTEFFLSLFLQDPLVSEEGEDVLVMQARQDHWWVIYELLARLLRLPLCSHCRYIANIACICHNIACPLSLSVSSPFSFPFPNSSRLLCISFHSKDTSHSTISFPSLYSHRAHLVNQAFRYEQSYIYQYSWAFIHPAKSYQNCHFLIPHY